MFFEGQLSHKNVNLLFTITNENVSWRVGEGIDFPKLINECIVSDNLWHSQLLLFCTELLVCKAFGRKGFTRAFSKLCWRFSKKCWRVSKILEQMPYFEHSFRWSCFSRRFSCAKPSTKKASRRPAVSSRPNADSSRWNADASRIFSNKWWLISNVVPGVPVLHGAAGAQGLRPEGLPFRRLLLRRACLRCSSHRIYLWIFKSQLPHENVNLLFTITDWNIQLTVLWGSWLFNTNSWTQCVR